MEYVYYAYTLITVVLLIYMLTKLKNTFRRKIDLRRMTSVCSGDRELARSLVVSALCKIDNDIENDFSS